MKHSSYIVTVGRSGALPSEPGESVRVIEAANEIEELDVILQPGARARDQELAVRRVRRRCEAVLVRLHEHLALLDQVRAGTVAAVGIVDRCVLLAREWIGHRDRRYALARRKRL